MENCCPQGSLGFQAPDYKVEGNEETLADNLKVFWKGSGKNAVLMVHDIFGYNSGRHKNIVAELAEDCGFLVAFPDLYRGEPLPEDSEDFINFSLKYPFEKLNKDLMTVVEFLKAKGAEKIGLIGFCWGAWVNAKLCSDSDLWVCAVNPHPSYQLEKFAFKGDDEGLAKTIKCPQLILPTGNDPDYVKEDGSFIKNL